MQPNDRRPETEQRDQKPTAATHAEKAAKAAPISQAEREKLAQEAARTEDA